MKRLEGASRQEKRTLKETHIWPGLPHRPRLGISWGSKVIPRLDYSGKRSEKKRTWKQKIRRIEGCSKRQQYGPTSSQRSSSFSALGVRTKAYMIRPINKFIILCCCMQFEFFKYLKKQLLLISGSSCGKPQCLRAHNFNSMDMNVSHRARKFLYSWTIIYAQV